jgi:calcineurin-like phosphoesterase family protein
MNAAVVDRWNRVVATRDTVYHLGDFTLSGIRSFNTWSAQLNGHLRILPGSHDNSWLGDFVASERIKLLPALFSLELHDPAQIIVLCHYSMQVWDRSTHGSWHLFGHNHGKLPGVGLSFDVGVDSNDFTPVSLAAVAARMAALQ